MCTLHLYVRNEVKKNSEFAGVDESMVHQYVLSIKY